MAFSDKRLIELGRRLDNSNPEIVKGTIISLRSEDPFSGAIRLLVETFDKTDNGEIRDKIREFMNDLKESALRDEVVIEIKKDYKPETIKMLVSSCWQSGLDYSLYGPDLAHVFNKSEYSVALECFTVIEESSQNLSRKIKDQIILVLKENEKAITDEKSALLAELISVLN
jgi:hypothetical protein